MSDVEGTVSMYSGCRVGVIVQNHYPPDVQIATIRSLSHYIDRFHVVDNRDETSREPLRSLGDNSRIQVVEGSMNGRDGPLSAADAQADDDAMDTTAAVPRIAGASVIVHEKNHGKAAGVQTALEYARSRDADAQVLLDGDGQHDPGDIQQLVAPALAGDADIVIGSRSLSSSTSGTISRVPIYRRLGQEILPTVTNMYSRTNVTDTQSGYRGLSRTAIETMDFTSAGFSSESDTIKFGVQQDLTILEVPIVVRHDVPNSHKKHPIAHGYDIVAKIAGEIGYERPLLLFGVVGFVDTVVGLVFGYWAFTTYSETGTLPYGTTIVSGICLGLGILLVVSGFILNSLVIVMIHQKKEMDRL